MGEVYRAKAAGGCAARDRARQRRGASPAMEDMTRLGPDADRHGTQPRMANVT